MMQLSAFWLNLKPSQKAMLLCRSDNLGLKPKLGLHSQTCKQCLSHSTGLQNVVAELMFATGTDLMLLFQ